VISGTGAHTGGLARFYQAFVFACGAAVMTVEMAASRLLAPFFGDSLLVWSNLIGIIMLGLTVGYYWGGWYADKHPRPEPLFRAVLSAGLWVSLLPLLARPLFRLLPGDVFATPTGLIIVSFAGASLAFLPPVVLLGWVSPYVLRLLNQSVESSGRLAGRLYAISTLGSLAGTFLPSLVTIPLLGTTATFALAGILLVGVSAWGFAFGRPQTAGTDDTGHSGKRRDRQSSKRPGSKSGWTAARFIPFLLLLIPATVLFGLRGPLKPVPGLVAEAESPYQFIQVWERQDTRYLVVNEGGGIQSLYRPGSPFGTGWYYDYFALLPYLYRNSPGAASDAPLKTLLVGYAGGTVARQLTALPAPYSSEVVGVEIDPEVVRLARQYMGGIPPGTRIAIADGRIWLRADRDDYDIIIVDAYSREMYIPFHLSTKEFFREAKAHLRPGGLIAINVNATQTGGLLASFYRTLAAVFPHVYWARAGGYMNYLLVASDSPLLPGKLPALISQYGPPELLFPATELASGWQSDPPAGHSLVFTDDRAPVEWFTDWMVVTYPSQS